MFGFFKKSWALAGVNATLKATGLDAITVRKITSSLSSEMWGIISNCSKGLNQQCSNLCNSMFALTLFTHFFENSIGWQEEKGVRLASLKVIESLDFQKQM